MGLVEDVCLVGAPQGRGVVALQYVSARQGEEMCWVPTVLATEHELPSAGSTWLTTSSVWTSESCHVRGVLCWMVLRRVKAWSHFKMQEYELAMRDVEEVLRRCPRDVDSYSLKAWAAWNLADYKTAVGALEAARNAVPASASRLENQWLLARAWAALERAALDEARQCASDGIDRIDSDHDFCLPLLLRFAPIGP